MTAEVSRARARVVTPIKSVTAAMKAREADYRAELVAELGGGDGA